MWGWLRHNFSSFRRAAQCGSGSFAIENACLPEKEKRRAGEECFARTSGDAQKA
jgi:hypothetical protein